MDVILSSVDFLPLSPYPNHAASNVRGRPMNYKVFGRKRSWSEILSQHSAVGMKKHEIFMSAKFYQADLLN
jgi:hypothetical protein